MLIEEQIDIDAPRAVVFDWLNDSSKVVRWVKNVISDEVIETRPGHVGTRFKQKLREGDRTFETDGEVLAYEQDKHLAIRVWAKGFEMHLTHDLEDLAQAAGTGTRLRQRAEIKFSGVMKFAMMAMGGMVEKKATMQFQEDTRRLKRFCEAEARGEDKSPHADAPAPTSPSGDDSKPAGDFDGAVVSLD